MNNVENTGLYRPILTNVVRNKVYQLQEVPIGTVYRHLEEGKTFVKVGSCYSQDKAGKDAIHALTDKVRVLFKIKG